MDYLKTYDDLLGEQAKYGIVYVTMPSAPMTSAAHAKMQARWIEANHLRIAELCVGVGFSLPSPLMRGVLRAILSMQTMPCPYRVFRTEEDARGWVLGLLE